MRTLVVTQNMTLDGSIEMLGDWFSPGAQDEELLAETHRQQAEADAFLVGRQTFEDLRGFWPQQTDDRTGVTDYLNQVQKYVVSATMTDPRWEPTTILSGDPAQEVRALKERDGLTIVCTGSIRLTHALIEADLVDEYRLLVFPVVQGRGRRLFPDGRSMSGLRLLAARTFPSGIALLHYAAR